MLFTEMTYTNNVKTLRATDALILRAWEIHCEAHCKKSVEKRHSFLGELDTLSRVNERTFSRYDKVNFSLVCSQDANYKHKAYVLIGKLRIKMALCTAKRKDIIEANRPLYDIVREYQRKIEDGYEQLQERRWEYIDALFRLNKCKITSKG
ncbi:hypothetical protein AB4254_10960 [Vibrio breoganii]